ncbi:hypothetical protein WDZ17_15560 [Pseudokineococcus basanitobsidens]|uniref:Uncharacterized protein n=1 Tax=Pseudokineococcus basanitobsidens TaxID=1926649 RepID=A0ABU8RNV6_9ACTN
MSPRAGRDPQRLLRWYPRGWRARHGQVLLGLLDEQVQDTGRELSWADAWSLRAHGAAQRFSPATGVLLALAGAAAAVAGLTVLAVSLADPAATVGAAEVVWTVLLTGVATSLASLAAVALVRDLIPITAPGAVLAAAAATAAWAAATAAALSWSVGFDQADADVPLSGFAAAFPALLVAGVGLGTVALTPVTAVLLRGISSTPGRWLLAVAGALLGSVVLGAAALAPGACLLAAVGVLVGCALRRSPHRRAPTTASRGPASRKATAEASQ